MRPIETLLLLVNLLAGLGLAVALPRAMHWLRHCAPVALLIAGTQTVAEGPRWQMMPAYALSGLLVLCWLWRWLWLRRTPAWAPAARGPSHRLAAAAAIGLGGLATVLAIALPKVFPVFGFPRPGGPYPIGTLTYHWIDATRLEAFGSPPQGRRELMVQVWYPAMADPAAQPAPYLQDADAVTQAFARIHHKPPFMFGHFKYVGTHAIASAPVARAQADYPVLLFLAGVTGFRQMNTFQVEELVSQGYIVAAIDQPGAAAAVIFPDGRQAPGMTLAQARSRIGPSYLPGPSAPPMTGDALAGAGLIRYLADDANFTLDQLAAINRIDPNGILTGKLDLRRVGAFGVSLGGIVVAEACHLTPQLKACLMMDAPMPTDVVTAGLRQPSLWITRDVDSMRLERRRAGGWPEAEIQAHQTTLRSVYQSLPGAGYFVRVPGMFHSNFTDIPTWSPWASMMGLAGPINGQRAHDIVNAYAVAFFDRHLSDLPARLPLPLPQYPEVLFESRRP